MFAFENASAHRCTIGHFQAVLSLCFKPRLSEKPLIWRWFFVILTQINLIFTTKVLHLILACVASVSVRFWSKERGTGVKDRAKNGASKRAGKGWERKLRFPSFPFPSPLSPLSLFSSQFISRAAKPKIPFTTQANLTSFWKWELGTRKWPIHWTELTNGTFLLISKITIIGIILDRCAPSRSPQKHITKSHGLHDNHSTLLTMIS